MAPKSVGNQVRVGSQEARALAHRGRTAGHGDGGDARKGGLDVSRGDRQALVRWGHHAELRGVGAEMKARERHLTIAGVLERQGALHSRGARSPEPAVDEGVTADARAVPLLAPLAVLGAPGGNPVHCLAHQLDDAEQGRPTAGGLRAGGAEAE